MRRLVAIIIFSCLWVSELYAFSANKVWMELRSNGRFRITVNYTIPELKEFREAWVEFSRKADADAYYFDLIRGADFYVPKAAARSFSTQSGSLDPW